MMKKFLALLTVLCLACGTEAFAMGTLPQVELTNITYQGNTEVKYYISPSDTYTVTIPQHVSLRENGSNGEIKGNLSIKIDGSEFNKIGCGVQVVLQQPVDGFSLVNENDNNKLIKYSVNKTGVVCSWYYDPNDLTNIRKTTTLTCSIEPTATNGLPAGNYTGTLTFTTSVVEKESSEQGGAE